MSQQVNESPQKGKGFEVEKIVGRSTKVPGCNGKAQYLVKWKDCPSTDNSWLPPEEIKKITGSLDLIEDYNRKPLIYRVLTSTRYPMGIPEPVTANNTNDTKKSEREEEYMETSV